MPTSRCQVIPFLDFTDFAEYMEDEEEEEEERPISARRQKYMLFITNKTIQPYVRVYLSPFPSNMWNVEH